MKITVMEAMRIKNQISESVNAIHARFHNVQIGEMREDDGTVVGCQDDIKLLEFIDMLKKAYSISESINSIISKYNIESGISDAVRHKSNLEQMRSFLVSACQDSTPRKSTRHEVVDQKRVAITQTFIPFVTKQEIKGMIKEIKVAIREAQNLIDSKNAVLIEVPFSYDDIESLES